MQSSYTAAHNMPAACAQQETQHPRHVVVRADGRFPYRPEIVSGLYIHLFSHDRASAHILAYRQVCPLPERKYEAQIGLREMEEQAARTALSQQILARWSLEALASRAEGHFAHLRSPAAVMSCTLCRTSVAGAAVLDWVLTVTSTNPAAPYPVYSPLPRVMPTSQASSFLNGRALSKMPLR
jgi:hypothetical protein